MRTQTAIVIVSLLAYAVAGFAYMHSTFVSKDIFEMLVKKLDRIEIKVDKLRSKE